MPASTTNRIRDAFNSKVSSFEKYFGVTADYSPASISELERNLDGMYPLGTTPAPHMVAMAGYYVGEVFIQNITGATWDDTLFEYNPMGISLNIEDKILMVNPPEMVFDYIRHPGNSMSRLFQFYSEVACGERVFDEKGKISGKQVAGVSYIPYGG